MMSEKTCRWGILSTANIAEKNWLAIKNSGNATVSGVASRSVEKAQAFIDSCQSHAPLATPPKAYGSYEELFAELHEKYKGGKIAPELSLLLRLGFSAAVVNFTNKALSTSVPGFNDVMRQNPDLMKAFTDATVNSMSQNSPAFAMANDMMSNTPKPTGPPPPAPQATQTARSSRPETRPDLSHAESGIELDTAGKVTQEKSARPEMRGPKNSDIDDLLAGLKTKNVNIQKKKSDSVVSAASVADMTDGKVPKRTQKRKQKSDRSIALDI